MRLKVNVDDSLLKQELKAFWIYINDQETLYIRDLVKCILSRLGISKKAALYLDGFYLPSNETIKLLKSDELVCVRFGSDDEASKIKVKDSKLNNEKYITHQGHDYDQIDNNQSVAAESLKKRKRRRKKKNNKNDTVLETTEHEVSLNTTDMDVELSENQENIENIENLEHHHQLGGYSLPNTKRKRISYKLAASGLLNNQPKHIIFEDENNIPSEDNFVHSTLTALKVDNMDNKMTTIPSSIGFAETRSNESIADNNSNSTIPIKNIHDLKPGDMVLFRMLELSTRCFPEVSNEQEASVISINFSDNTVELKRSNSCIHQQNLKYKNFINEDHEDRLPLFFNTDTNLFREYLDGDIQCNFNELLDLRIRMDSHFS